MAKFIHVSSPTGNYHYAVNVETVTYVQQNITNQNQCSVHFSGEPSLSIGMSAADFAMMAKA
jgi:hypothetical protein